MDKNQGIGILLIFLVLVVYYQYTAPSQEEIERHQFVQDSIALAEVKTIENNNTISAAAATPQQSIPDSVKAAQLNTAYGPFSNVMVGSSSMTVLENEMMTVSVDSKGGSIKNVTLKEHYKVTEDSAFVQSKALLNLMEDEKNKFEYFIPTQNYGQINTADLYYQPQLSGNTLVMTATLADGKTIAHKYVLEPNSYKMKYALKLNGINQMMSPSGKLKFKWHHYLDKVELNTNFEKYYATIYYKESNEGSDYCSCRSDDKKEINDKRVEWVSHVNQFFNTSIMPSNKKFENGVFETVMFDKEDEDLKLLKTEVDIPLDLVSEENIEMDIYIGPNEFEDLLSYDNGLEEIIPFGRSIFGSINRWVIRPAFNWLQKFISSKAITIIVLIFILKMLLYPLMYKMLHSQAKMGLLKPELAHLKTKYKDEPQKIQMETMKIYREYGVSPLGGCMPSQESFLWATDLSSYDVFFRLPFDIPAFGAHVSLFTILWAATTIIYSYYNMRHMDMSANPMMKYVQYFMPVTFLFFFNTYASGLTVYMFFSNVFNIAQTIITKKFVFNDDKLRAELDLQKAKPKKKKGGFQARLEEAMKAQQEAQKKNKKK